jgi:hypothetical protein
MRTLIHIYILLFSFILIIACSKEEKLGEVVYEIPIEDRCVFTEGDTLLYSCSNGSTDTVFVKNVDFITETGTYTVSGTDMHNYITETQSMFIETSHDNWKYENIDSRCFRINTLPKYDDLNVENFPWCDILNGCEYTGSRVIAEKLAEYDEKIFNDKSYKNVYYQSRGDMNNGFEIYWNLKYGIISFVGISNGTKLIWQLEGKVLQDN